MSTLNTKQEASADLPERCPACGRPLVNLTSGRCPICDFAVADEPVTGEDRSPYAQSTASRRRAWWGMCRWVWGAGRERLGHLALMRSSAASRRFARATVVRLALTSAVCCLLLSGWHAIEPLPGVAEVEHSTPTGKGWLPVAEATAESLDGRIRRGEAVALWWNALQGGIGAALAIIWAAILARLLSVFLAKGVETSLGKQHRGQGRLTAALCYSAAWAVPLLPAGLLLALSPISEVAELAGWSFQPPALLFFAAAAVLGALGLLAWWFGLIRLATTVPVRSRRRVLFFCMIWVPLVGTTLLAAPAWGMWYLRDLLIPVLHLQW